MTRRGNKTEQQEALVYLAECPDHGPEHRIYDEQDICVAGGVRAIEAELERESDRFVRLGVIKAKKTANETTSEVRAAQSLFAGWKCQEDQEEGMGVGFVPKRVRVGCLASLASSLCAVGEAFDTLSMTVIKYWDDPNSKITPPIDLPDWTVSEFALALPIRIRWGSGDRVIVSDVIPFLYC